jgi:hypothetical protein
VTIMSKADGDLIPWAMVAASVGIVGLFAVQIALRREVEQDPAEQEWLRKAAIVASHGDEIERQQAELAARS